MFGNKAAAGAGWSVLVSWRPMLPSMVSPTSHLRNMPFVKPLFRFVRLRSTNGHWHWLNSFFLVCWIYCSWFPQVTLCSWKDGIFELLINCSMLCRVGIWTWDTSTQSLCESQSRHLLGDQVAAAASWSALVSWKPMPSSMVSPTSHLQKMPLDRTSVLLFVPCSPPPPNTDDCGTAGVYREV